MKFLLDENQSPRIVDFLVEAGRDAIHVRDIDLRTSPDEDVLAAALGASRVIISADTDFGGLLAAYNATGPSIVLLRRQAQRRAHDIAALTLANLNAVAEEIQLGAVVVLDEKRIRIRRPHAPARLTSRWAARNTRCMQDVCIQRVFRRVRSCCPVHGV